MNLPATTATFALCHATNGASTNDQTILDCGPTVGADYMEMYPTENEVQMGDLVIAGNNYITTQNGDRMVKLKKSTQAYQGNIIGIASDPSQANDFNSIGYNINEGDRPYPIALNGRVKVKVTDEGGSIAVGDYLTASSTSGKAMKANKASMVVGKALESWDPASGQDMIMVFVNITYYDPDIYNLATSDDLNLIIENTDGPVTTYNVLNNITGDVVSKVGAFSEAVIGELTAGSITTDYLDVRGVDIFAAINGIGSDVSALQSEFQYISGATQPDTSQFQASIQELQDKVASIEASLITISDTTASVSATLDIYKNTTDDRIIALETAVQAMGGDLQISQLISNLKNILTIDTVGGESTATFLSDMTVIGDATVNNLTSLGEINAGLLKIDAIDNSINVIGGGTLKLQDSVLGGNIEAFGGKLVMTDDGGIVAQGTIKAKQVTAEDFAVLGETTLQQETLDPLVDSTVGDGTILAGDTEIIIDNLKVKPDSKIFITPVTSTDGEVLVVEEKLDGSFRVVIKNAIATDIKFDYWIVKVE